VLAVAISLENPIMTDALKAKPQGSSVTAISLGSQRNECRNFKSKARKHVTRVVLAAVVDDDQLRAGNSRDNFLVPFPNCEFNDLPFIEGGHDDRDHVSSPGWRRLPFTASGNQ